MWDLTGLMAQSITLKVLSVILSEFFLQPKLLKRSSDERINIKFIIANFISGIISVIVSSYE